jgi:hypothetical protein
MTDEETERDPFLDVLALEHDTGVRAGFFRELLTGGDDWSFVIKVHALIEGAVSHLLTEMVGQPKLADLFSLLELSNLRTGKVAFAKALECLDGDELQTIRKLSELRNRLVHDVSNVDFKFSDWTKGLDPQQLGQWTAAFLPGDSIDVGDHEIPTRQYFKENARISVWLRCLFLLSLVYQRKELAKDRRELELRQQDLAKRVLDGSLFEGGAS